MIAIIWRFEVVQAHRAEFEAAYGPTGDWARLFARSGGFRGTELLRAADGSYVTLDVWRAAADFDAFHPAFSSARRDAGIGPVPMIDGSTPTVA